MLYWISKRAKTFSVRPRDLECFLGFANPMKHDARVFEVKVRSDHRSKIFRLLPSNCLNWKKNYGDNHSSLSSTNAVQYEFHIYFTVFEVLLNDKLMLFQMFLFRNASGSGKNLSDLMGNLPNNCIELLCRKQLASEASFPFAGHKMPINMRASLTKGELRDVMESIGEVEKCLGKILELKEAYKKLDNY